MRSDISQKENPFFHLEGMEIKQVGKSNLSEVQSFLGNFDDFFILCEGVKGSALSIFSACPASRNLATDKLCLGVFKNNDLIGFLDLIKNYPANGVLTIGYMLIHPLYRSQGLGTRLLNALSQWASQKGFSKVRLCVQDQNARALSFWVKNGFEIVGKVKENPESKNNETHILERSINE